MKQKHVMPAFKSDAEEAERWYNNRASLDKVLSKRPGRVR
jgi:hypothetical protein